VGKIITTSLTIGSGGSAGVFGPSMVIGGTLGAAVGQGFHSWIPGIVSHPGSFAVVGMAGFFTAAAKTPLSTIIMVSEMTGSYELLVPTMWVCALALLVSRRWTIYRSQVPTRVFSPAHFGDYAMETMGHTEVGEVFRKERRWIAVPADLPIRDILRLTAETRQRVYPVVDVHGQLVGTFHQGELMQALHDEYPENPDPRARDLIPRMRLHLFSTDTLSMAQRLMSSRGVDELVVCNDDGSVAGILAGSDVLMAYNRRLSEEDGDPPAAKSDSGAFPRNPSPDSDSEFP
jgi:CIC family chloride channel protein